MKQTNQGRKEAKKQTLNSGGHTEVTGWGGVTQVVGLDGAGSRTGAELRPRTPETDPTPRPHQHQAMKRPSHKTLFKSLTLPGVTRLSMPTKSRCSSVSFWRFSSRARLCWSADVTSVMAWRASVGRGPSAQARAGGHGPPHPRLCDRSCPLTYSKVLSESE